MRKSIYTLPVVISKIEAVVITASSVVMNGSSVAITAAVVISKIEPVVITASFIVMNGSAVATTEAVVVMNVKKKYNKYD